MTKAERVLRAIKRSKNGMTTAEVRRFICKMNGKDYDATVDRCRYYPPKPGLQPQRRKYSGYWSSYLFGQSMD